MTIQLLVGDGAAARRWYEQLFERPPDFHPHGDDTFCEWIFRPGYWEVHVVEHATPGLQRSRLRFGVDDIDVARQRLAAGGVEPGTVEELPGVVRYCNFEDPWGNRLGFYQDGSRWPW